MFRKIQIPKVTLKQSLGKYKTNAHKCMQTDKNHKKNMGYSLKELQLSMNIEKKREKNAHKEGKKLS